MDGDNSSDVGAAEGDEEECAWVTYFCTLKGNEFFCQVFYHGFHSNISLFNDRRRLKMNIFVMGST